MHRTRTRTPGHKAYSIAWTVGVFLVLASCATRPVEDPHPHPVGYISIPEAILAYLDAQQARGGDEQAFALLGYVEGLTVVVEGFDAVRVLAATDSSVSYVAYRNPRLIGTAHTHPSGNCSPSDVDVHGLTGWRFVSLVACGGGRFGAALKGSPRMEFYQMARTP